MKDCMKINEILNTYYYDMNRMFWATSRLAWLKRFRKAPTELLNALIFKCTKILEKDWLGDEPQEQIIKEYLSK